MNQGWREQFHPIRAVGDYCILREIGRGGMGMVYEAEQISLGRRVALKVLPAHTAQVAKAVERFRREARAAARLHHTNIVPVFEVGQEGDICWYAMQLIQGQSLDQIVEELRNLRSHSQAVKQRLPPVDLRDQETVAPHPPAMSQITQSLLTEDFVPRSLTGSTATQVQSASSTTSVVLPGQAEFARVKADHHHYFRSIARIGHQTATALAYAHAAGSSTGTSSPRT